MAIVQNIAAYHQALREKKMTVSEMVKNCLEHIESKDQVGPELKAVIAINPHVLEEAASMEDREVQGALFGVPVLIKDNIDVKGMATTAGNLNLLNNMAKEDAFIVKKIREAGGLVIAKTNLHEFAIWGESLSSVGSQTKNPYDLTRTPGGSSGGTGAALAAGYGMVGLGTDTINSVRSPASACHLVGLRPSKGQVSLAGIVPYSFNQDTAGPMGQNIKDVRLLFEVIRGYDKADPYSLDQQLLPAKGDSLRVGILRSFYGKHPDVLRAMDRVEKTLAAAGVELVELHESYDNQYLIDEVSLHLHDFKDHLNQYLARLPQESPVHSLEDILKSGKYHPGIYDNMVKASGFSTQSAAYRERVQRVVTWTKKLEELFKKEKIDAMLYPHQQQLVCKIGASQVGRNGVLASLSGFPSLAVPAGFSVADQDAPQGVPIGAELLGLPLTENTLFHLGTILEEGFPILP